MAKVTRSARARKLTEFGRLKKDQLVRFVRRRNKSGFSSNLQFQIDANAEGFKVEALGPVAKFTIGGIKGYQWKPAVIGYGETRLIEFGRTIYLHGNHDVDTMQMFELMNEATFVVDDEKVDKSGLTDL